MGTRPARISDNKNENDLPSELILISLPRATMYKLMTSRGVKTLQILHIPDGWMTQMGSHLDRMDILYEHPP